MKTSHQNTCKYNARKHQNTIKEVKELNKMIQDLKIKRETIKKSQMEAILEMET